MSYGRFRVSRRFPPKIKENQGREGPNFFFEEKSKKSREKLGGIKINP